MEEIPQFMLPLYGKYNLFAGTTPFYQGYFTRIKFPKRPIKSVSLMFLFIK